MKHYMYHFVMNKYDLSLLCSNDNFMSLFRDLLLSIATIKHLEVSSIFDIQIEKLVRYSIFEIQIEKLDRYSIFEIQTEELVRYSIFEIQFSYSDYKCFSCYYAQNLSLASRKLPHIKFSIPNTILNIKLSIRYP